MFRLCFVVSNYNINFTRNLDISLLRNDPVLRRCIFELFPQLVRKFEKGIDVTCTIAKIHFSGRKV
jgi:hypothetical protein